MSGILNNCSDNYIMQFIIEMSCSLKGKYKRLTDQLTDYNKLFCNIFLSLFDYYDDDFFFIPENLSFKTRME